MRHVLRASALSSVLAVATAASAADLPRRGAPSGDYYAPMPVFSWSGPYLGLNLGLQLGSFTQASNLIYGSSSAGVLGGIQGGYNFQVAPNLILGVEGDIDGSSLRGNSTLPFFGLSGQAEMNLLVTARGRVGYTIDRAMFFATGGLAAASVDVRISDWRSLAAWNNSQWRTGWTIGGGLEYAVTNNISAKVEYLYTSIRDDDQNAFARDYSRVGLEFSTLKAGVNYHF